jgi:hypothetical protein
MKPPNPLGGFFHESIVNNWAGTNGSGGGLTLYE